MNFFVFFFLLLKFEKIKTGKLNLFLLVIFTDNFVKLIKQKMIKFLNRREEVIGIGGV